MCNSSEPLQTSIRNALIRSFNALMKRLQSQATISYSRISSSITHHFNIDNINKCHELRTSKQHHEWVVKIAIDRTRAFGKQLTCDLKIIAGWMIADLLNGYRKKIKLMWVQEKQSLNWNGFKLWFKDKKKKSIGRHQYTPSW